MHWRSRWARARVTNPGTVALAVQGVCYVSAVAILVLGVGKLPAFAETPRDLLFGVLLISTVSLLIVALGVLVQIMSKVSAVWAAVTQKI